VAHPQIRLTRRLNKTLTTAERITHDRGIVSVLVDLHAALDRAVFAAYGWPNTLENGSIVERVLALNAQRARDERRGIVTWLRPAFQRGRVALPGSGTQERLQEATVAASVTKWPKQIKEQLDVVRRLLAVPRSKAEIRGLLKGARTADVEAILESLALLGLAVSHVGASGVRWRATSSVGA
jgi:hypothetical protein